MNDLSTESVTCRQATAAEAMPAVRLILGGGGGQFGDEAAAVDLMRYAATRGTSLAELWVAVEGGRLAWAGLPLSSPGRTALVVGTPVDVSNASAAAAGIAAVCVHLGRRGVHLAQALHDPSLAGTTAAFLGQGFTLIAELIYLSKSVRRFPMPTAVGGFTLSTYTEALHGPFAAAILASYEDSLDCPALNGVRGIGDVMDGHKSAGVFDPADWFLLSDRAGHPVAVLLLARMLGGEGMELVYLGLAPAARRRGVGNYLLRLALARVAEQKLRRLSLAVDARNAPALALYFRHGFEEIARKTAMVKEVGEAEERIAHSA